MSESVSESVGVRFPDTVLKSCFQQYGSDVKSELNSIDKCNRMQKCSLREFSILLILYQIELPKPIKYVAKNHENALSCIRTPIIQVPGKDNERQALEHAELLETLILGERRSMNCENKIKL